MPDCFGVVEVAGDSVLCLNLMYRKLPACADWQSALLEIEIKTPPAIRFKRLRPGTIVPVATTLFEVADQDDIVNRCAAGEC